MKNSLNKVVNDRWGAGGRILFNLFFRSWNLKLLYKLDICHHGDYYTCDDRYSPGKLLNHKWENCMTLVI